MNIARTLCTKQYNCVSRNFARKFRFSSQNYESSQATQPQVQEEKFNFEDLQVTERTETRREKITPFMKDIFVSKFNRDLLGYPEILNKDEFDTLNHRVELIDKVFQDKSTTKEERRNTAKTARLFAAPVSWTRNGLAMNFTESIRYLESISTDYELSSEMSDHWVALRAIQHGLTEEQYSAIIDDLITGEKTIALCIKESVAERVAQADFRTNAVLDEHGVWRISGEKVCKYNDGYLLVLSAIETGKLKAFLVHPHASGVTAKGNFIQLLKTPGTPLDLISDNQLAQIFGSSRLHAATLCRCQLKQAMHAVVEYVRPRAFSGKPLAELPTIRATVGDALLDIYASESAEYFTAGLLDGYVDPETELEMAMCRNFMVNHGMLSMFKLLAIPSLEKDEECKVILDNMRRLSVRGESLDSINMFISLTGIHHAGKEMAHEVKQIRNPLHHPGFIIRKMIANRHQENDNPKLTLHLAEHLHPTLKPASEYLEYCTLRIKFACETLMARYGMDITSAYTELNRLAEAATYILMMTSVLARASRSYCIGLRNAEVEMKLAGCFVDHTKDKVKRLILEIDNGEYLNLDRFRIEFGRKVLDTNTTLVENPTNRVVW